MVAARLASALVGRPMSPLAAGVIALTPEGPIIVLDHARCIAATGSELYTGGPG
jgi:hypothetical protein